MSLADLSSIGGFVSGIAVLVSLMYLSRQISVSTKNQRASIHQARLQVRTAWTEQLARKDSVEMFMRGSRGDETLTDTECNQYFLYVISDLLAYEEWFFQHDDGMVDQRRWASNLKSLTIQLRDPGFRASWFLGRDFFEAEFAALVESLIAAAPPVAANPLTVASSWRNLAVLERAKVAV